MKKVLRPGLGLCALTLLCWLLDFASVAGKGGYASSLKEGVLGAGRLLHFHATLSESTVYIYIYCTKGLWQLRNALSQISVLAQL